MSIPSCGLGHNQGPALGRNDQYPIPGRDDDDDVLDAVGGAVFVGLALVTFWRRVAAGALPPPFYPSPRAPRWRKGELRAACEQTRMLPRQAKALRRAARLGVTETATTA